MASEKWHDFGAADDLSSRPGAAPLVDRCTALAARLLPSASAPVRVARGGRKAHALAPRE